MEGHAQPIPTHPADEVKPKQPRTVAGVVGETIASHEVTDAFGVIGSGNFVATDALAAAGTRFHHARHEGGAIMMADGYARVSGKVGVCSVHQGPGLTNTMTGLAEAAKCRTPVLVLAGDTPAAAVTSNFRIDQHDLVESVGAIAERVHGAKTAVEDARRAYARAEVERRPVVLMLPIDVAALPAEEPRPTARVDGAPGRDGAPPPPADPPATGPPTHPAPPTESIAEAAALIAQAERPAIVAGRGAVLAEAGSDIEALGERIGAVLATSAMANGLFHGLPYSLGIAGGFASPFAAQTLQQADLYIAFGASLNRWTTKQGQLINPAAKVIQIDVEPRALGRNRPADLKIVGDARQGARALAQAAPQMRGWRTPELRDRIQSRRWQHEPYEDTGTNDWIDPRTLSKALNERLPADRLVAVDSGHLTGYPAMYIDVRDARAWIFANGFQAVGLGLGSAIGAAIAEPNRISVAALGDGGAFMALPELETAVRLKLGNLLVLVYDDAAYGAEVHHFAPMGFDVSRVRFSPEPDLAAIAMAMGARGATVRSIADLDVINEWLEAPSGHPLVLDAKVNPNVCAEWLEDAFRAG